MVNDYSASSVRQTVRLLQNLSGTISRRFCLPPSQQVSTKPSTILCHYDRLLAHRGPQVEEVGDDWYLVKTGGMSWGDSPTDIFDVIVDYVQLPDIIDAGTGGAYPRTPPQVLRLVPSVDEVACPPV